jgi:hypothetical protein
MKKTSIALAAVAIFAAAFAAKKPDSKPASSKPASDSSSKGKVCSACKETKPVLSPADLDDAFEDARPSYAAASKYPETVDKLRCFCGCEESPNLHHKNLLTCFTSLHATGCEICQGEANMAGKMKGEGSTDEEVKGVVEAIYEARK